METSLYKTNRSERSRMRNIQMAVVLGGLSLVFGFVQWAQRTNMTAFASESPAAPAQFARAIMGEQITVRAAGRGNPWINLQDGHEVLTAYSGPADLTRALEQNQVTPLSLASGDYDEDGVPDLISGYAGPGGGIITLLRGNVDSIYPNAPEAKQRKAAGTFTDAPFLSPGFVFSVPAAPDFIGAGDFDGDGHWDLVSAARNSNYLNLLSGDGKGGIGPSRRVALSGAVTALLSGEINRADGLDDVIVGINGSQGPKALVFEGPEGALRANPEIIDLSAEANSFALGELDGEYTKDLAIAAGNELIVVCGRDRKLSQDAKTRSEVSKATLSKLRFASDVVSVATGDFTGNHNADLAVLLDDGSLNLITRGNDGIQTKTSKQKIFQATSMRLNDIRQKNSIALSVPRTKSIDAWHVEPPIRGGWSGNARLIRARVSNTAVDSLVIVGANRSQFQILTKSATEDGTRNLSQVGSPETIATELEMDSQPVAVWPMRLNEDALNDLVVLRTTQYASVMLTSPANRFVVTKTGDGMGVGTLRRALVDANTAPGADVITFDIRGSEIPTIKLKGALPTIIDPVTIDASTQASGRVELDATDAGFEKVGLYITCGNSVVRGFVINHVRSKNDGLLTSPTGANAIVLEFNEGNFIEGNFVGTDAMGNESGGNQGFGIVIDESSNNTIGGTTPAARNVISGNQGSGIIIETLFGAATRDNKIQGNFIGTSASGLLAVPNAFWGVLILGDGSPSVCCNLIGGTTPGAGNVISGNAPLDNLFILDSTGNIVQGNVIGLNSSGTGQLLTTISSPRSSVAAVSAPIGEGRSGVIIADPEAEAANLIGGTVVAARNVISGNTGSGIIISSARDNLVQGNFIGTDVSGTYALPNTLDGVDLSGAAGTTIGGSVEGARNLISGNGGRGVSIHSSAGTVQGNLIGTDITGSQAVGNGSDGVGISQSPNAMIGGTGGNERNIISGNVRNGITIGLAVIPCPVPPPAEGCSPQESIGQIGATVQGNYIGTDLAGANSLANGQDGIFVEVDTLNNVILENRIAFNNRNGVSVPNFTTNGSNPGVRIAIKSNSVFSNNTLGIDLGGDNGVTANDSFDTDTGANFLQNFPLLTSAISGSGTVTVTGTLNSEPMRTFGLEFFIGPGCSGDHQMLGGAKILGSRLVTTDLSGNASYSFSFALPSEFSTGFINATATDPNGNTSEFSQCTVVGGG